MYSIWRMDTTAKGAKKNTSPNVIHLQYFVISLAHFWRLQILFFAFLNADILSCRNKKTIRFWKDSFLLLEHMKQNILWAFRNLISNTIKNVLMKYLSIIIHAIGRQYKTFRSDWEIIHLSLPNKSVTYCIRNWGTNIAPLLDSNDDISVILLNYNSITQYHITIQKPTMQPSLSWWPLMLSNGLLRGKNIKAIKNMKSFFFSKYTYHMPITSLRQCQPTFACLNIIKSRTIS